MSTQLPALSCMAPKTYYPSFGEQIGKATHQPIWVTVAWKIGLTVTKWLSLLRLIPSSWYETLKSVSEYHFKRTLPHDPPCEGPFVGKYYEAKLLVSEQADESYKWKEKLIQSAEKSIELSASFGGGAEYQHLLFLIEEQMKKKEELKVHLLVSSTLLEPENQKKLQELVTRYPSRFFFQETEVLLHVDGEIHTEENHVKLLVVDEKYFVMGGTNIHPNLSHETETTRFSSQSQSAAVNWTLAKTVRDNDIVGEGEMTAHVMRKQFYHLFQLYNMHSMNKPAGDQFFPVVGAKGECEEFQKAHPLEGVRMKVIVGGPEHRDDNPITRQYVTRIRKAKRSIVLDNMQFYPHETIQQALLHKKEEKVPVTLVTGGTMSALGCLTQVMASRVHYDLSTKVYEYQVPGQLLHKKMALFDDRHALIGSYNLGKKSSLYDHEMVCVIKDERIHDRFAKIVEEDISRSREVSKGSLSPSFVERIVGAIVSPFKSFI